MFEKALNGMRDGVLIVDANGIIVFANPVLSDIFAIPREDLLGRRPLEAIRLAELMELIEEVRKTGKPCEREIRIVYPEEKDLLASGNIAQEGVAMVFRDISEVKKLENLRSEFVANVSHELKTPLTAIKSYTETLLRGALDDSTANRKFLEKIEKNVNNLTALIDDILEVSRLEARRRIAPFETIHLEEEVDRAIETLSVRIKEKNLDIVKLGKPGVGEIKGEPNHIYRAVLNLLDNAVKYSFPGSKIEISCRTNGKKMELGVRDYGVGIPAEHHPRIFERFYRVDKARSRELGGTGLGLAIVKHIMEVHGGKVLLESEEGGGAKFTLVFPVD